jgi:hypothetical protein
MSGGKFKGVRARCVFAGVQNNRVRLMNRNEESEHKGAEWPVHLFWVPSFSVVDCVRLFPMNKPDGEHKGKNGIPIRRRRGGGEKRVRVCVC